MAGSQMRKTAKRERLLLLLLDTCVLRVNETMAPAQPTGRTTALGRPWSARSWYSSEQRKRSAEKHRPVPPPQRASSAPQSERRRRMFDGDLRAPLPARFATPTPPPWEPQEKLSAQEKQLQQLRNVLGPALRIAMENITTLTGRTHRERLLALHRVLDRNGDGLLSHGELRDGLEQLDPPLPITKKQLDDIFARIDPDGAAALGFEEFAAVFGLPTDTLPQTDQENSEDEKAQAESKRTANLGTDSAAEVDAESSFICTRTSRAIPMSQRDVTWSPPASSLSARNRPTSFLKQGSGNGSAWQAKKRPDLAPTNDANATFFGAGAHKWKPFEHRDVTPEKWVGKSWDGTWSTLERLIEARPASLDAVDTTSPQALAAAAAIAADAARAGTEARSKFKFTPRLVRTERTAPPPVGRYQDLWHRALPLNHPEYIMSRHSPKHPRDWRRAGDVRSAREAD